jgi:AcrR family transcriptional regulator
MRRPDPVARESRKRKILDSARHLFARHGYDCVSMDRLAAECQLTKPALYYYFENKRAVLLATLQAHWVAQSAVLEAFRPSKDLGRTLRAFAELTLAETRRAENGDVIRIVMAETARHPEIGQAFFDVFGPTFRSKLEALLAPHLEGRRPQRRALALLHQFVGGLAHYSLISQMFRPAQGYLPDQRTYVALLVQTLVNATQPGSSRTSSPRRRTKPSPR